MRISDYYNLDQTQPTLDFVDVTVDHDVAVFIDPTAIRAQHGEWAEACQALMRSFFSVVLDAIRQDEPDRVRDLLRELIEPNETRLGLSSGRPRGRGLGGGTLNDAVADALSESRAAQSGLLEDLEDTVLFVPGIGPDIISDMTTHIIRGALIGYTQHMCDFYDIPVEEQWSGPVWNPDLLEWQSDMVLLPRADGGRLLLVPKSIVRLRLTVDKDKYYNGYIAPLLENAEIDARSALVQILKNGKAKVPRPELREKYGDSKLALIEHTDRFPTALAAYRSALAGRPSQAPDHQDLHDRTGTPLADYRALLDEVMAISPGPAGATSYQRAAAALLTALFDTSLGNAQLEVKIHEGRKRLDIRFDNIARTGFFDWIRHWPSATIVVECKNYTGEVANPELDQLIGRFSDQRGRVGILLCRNLDDKELFKKRCRDTADDRNGYILVLDDDDLKTLVDYADENRDARPDKRWAYPLLRERFGELID